MFYDIFWKPTGDFIVFHSDTALKDYKFLFQSNLVYQPVKEDVECGWVFYSRSVFVALANYSRLPKSVNFLLHMSFPLQVH